MARRLLQREAMRFQWTFFALALGLGGCVSHAIEDRANERLSDERMTAQRNARYATCPDRGVISGNCGLILKHASTEDFRAKFRDSKCVGKDDATCEVVYQRMIDAWLIARYPHADWRAVTLACDGDPGRCDDPVAYERLLLASHNTWVYGEQARAENQIDEERRAAQNAHIRAQVQGVAQVLDAAAYAAHKGPKCRSYPSAFSGVTTTICTN
jgi:hypothetical protein